MSGDADRALCACGRIFIRQPNDFDTHKMTCMYYRIDAMADENANLKLQLSEITKQRDIFALGMSPVVDSLRVELKERELQVEQLQKIVGSMPASEIASWSGMTYDEAVAFLRSFADKRVDVTQWDERGAVVERRSDVVPPTEHVGGSGRCTCGSKSFMKALHVVGCPVRD